jgi:hypothetical protein
MAVAAGCGSAHDAASSAGQPDPEEADITVAALPAVDLAGLYIAKYDKLPSIVTAAMALPGYPTGPVAKTRIQRVAVAMLQYGILSPHYAAEVEQGTLVESMLGPAS